MQRSQRGLVEDFARQMMTKEIGHDFKHADRVRNWALRIAQEEGYEDLQAVEVAALLHDIGLAQVKKRSLHGPIGSLMAVEFLTEKNIFPEDVVKEIGTAIRYHNSIQHGNGRLLDIVRDADILDLLGAIGIMRAYTSLSSRPEYDPENVKGEMWGASAREYDRRFDEGLGTGDYIVDHLNFHISCYGNLHTEAAKRLAKPLVEFIRDFIIQLESEVMGS